MAEIILGLLVLAALAGIYAYAAVTTWRWADQRRWHVFVKVAVTVVGAIYGILWVPVRWYWRYLGGGRRRPAAT